MKKFILMAFVGVLTSGTALALPWNNLKTISLSKNGNIALQIEPKLVEKIIFDSTTNSKEEVLFLSEKPHPLVICRLNENDPTHYQIDFEAGPSDDPTFLIRRLESDGKMVLALEVNALKIYIPGNNAIYTEGHTNNLFNQKRKYLAANDTISEVKQPFYSVGIKGKLYQDFTLYADTNLKQVVAKLPANSQVEVLLAENTDFYKPKLLLKTDFGLTGWVEVIGSQFDWVESEPGKFSGNGIEGIYFAGD